MNQRYRFPRCVGGLVLLMLSAVLFGLSYFMAQPGLDLWLNGIRTEGTITAMALVMEPESAGYAPTVRFKDGSGMSHEIKHPFITADPIGRVGDAAGAYYFAEDPAGARLDHWLHLWNWGFIPGAVGAVLLLAAIPQLVSRRSKPE